MQNKKTTSIYLKVRTAIKSGYWTCTGVTGQANVQGYYLDKPQAAVCYKPKYAPLFGAPAAPGGGEN